MSFIKNEFYHISYMDGIESINSVVSQKINRETAIMIKLKHDICHVEDAINRLNTMNKDNAANEANAANAANTANLSSLSIEAIEAKFAHNLIVISLKHMHAEKMKKYKWIKFKTSLIKRMQWHKL